MSRLDEPIKSRFDQAGSRLDQPIGITEGRQRDNEQRAVRSHLQTEKKQNSLIRRMFRQGRRSNNMGEMASALDALEWGKKNTGLTSGVAAAGASEDALKRRLNNTEATVDSFNNSRDERRANQPGVAGRLENGETVFDRLEDSGLNSGAWVDVGGRNNSSPRLQGFTSEESSPRLQGFTSQEGVDFNPPENLLNQEAISIGEPEDGPMARSSRRGGDAFSDLVSQPQSVSKSENPQGALVDGLIPGLPESEKYLAMKAEMQAKAAARAEQAEKNNLAFRTQQRLHSDYFRSVIDEEERSFKKNEGALVKTAGRKILEGEGPAPMNYDTFDPEKHPAPHSIEEQRRLSGDAFDHDGVTSKADPNNREIGLIEGGFNELSRKLTEPTLGRAIRDDAMSLIGDPREVLSEDARAYFESSRRGLDRLAAAGGRTAAHHLSPAKQVLDKTKKSFPGKTADYMRKQSKK